MDEVLSSISHLMVDDLPEPEVDAGAESRQSLGGFSVLDEVVAIGDDNGPVGVDTLLPAGGAAGSCPGAAIDVMSSGSSAGSFDPNHSVVDMVSSNGGSDVSRAILEDQTKILGIDYRSSGSDSDYVPPSTSSSSSSGSMVTTEPVVIDYPYPGSRERVSYDRPLGMMVAIPIGEPPVRFNVGKVTMKFRVQCARIGSSGQKLDASDQMAADIAKGTAQDAANDTVQLEDDKFEVVFKDCSIQSFDVDTLQKHRICYNDNVGHADCKDFHLKF